MVKSFGIDEMTALAGGSQTEDMAAFRPSVGGPQLANNKRKTLPNEEPDFSTMSAAETAAMLMEKNAARGTGASSSRYRTNRVLAHHALAQELSEEMQVRQAKEQKSREREEASSDESDEQSADEFMARKGTVRRQRAAPQIISRSQKSEATEDAVKHRQKRRDHDHDDDTSSGSEDRVEKIKLPRRPMGRGRRDSDDSSSSSDEEDRRRERLKARNRKRQEPQVIHAVTQAPAAKNEIEIEPPQSEGPKIAMKESPSSAVGKEGTRKREPAKKQSSSSESESSNGDSSDSDGASSSSDDSSNEEEEAIAKPVFVPKNKRNMLQSQEKKWEEEEKRVEREIARTEKRKMESRAMVAKTVAAVQSANVDEDAEEEGGGAINAPPNDDDDVDCEMERDAWEVRELRRLLDSMDELKRREKEMVERERRRQMTDEEVLQWDVSTGRYHAPGSNRDGQPTGKFLQRFYHRGAFYMAEDEWDEDDVRRKAAGYARAATGDDKINRSALPEVMQVKGFGFARQNTKYKGLTKEDTTDKKQTFLPLIQSKKK